MELYNFYIVVLRHSRYSIYDIDKKKVLIKRVAFMLPLKNVAVLNCLKNILGMFLFLLLLFARNSDS